MLYQVRKISPEQRFVIMIFLLSVLVSFFLGYVLFRYVQVDICKSPIEWGNTFIK